MKSLYCHAFYYTYLISIEQVAMCTDSAIMGREEKKGYNDMHTALASLQEAHQQTHRALQEILAETAAERLRTRTAAPNASRVPRRARPER